ncbi:DivIVA domain-containing protein [Bifidobacterium pullorum]|uniref:DivIVA domain-containing protein n=1 Tax=Bifidobacterium pullorum TaxID=78448 RepID=UPI0039945A52
MAQQPESGRNASGIARAGKRKWGYNPEQVDEFLERTHALYDSEDAQLTQQDIQNVSFDLSKGGYVISQVDAALGRLERAVVDQQTTREIARHGRVVWKAQTEDLYRSLAAHADRVARQRFRPGDAKAPSYDRKQVDHLVDQVIDKAAAELGVDGVTADDVKDLVDVNSTSVANVIFTQRKGKRGYDERQVDNYLNACVRLLSRIESYARVSDYVHDPATTPQRSTAAETAAAPALFPPRGESQPLDTAASPTVMDDDFAELHRVEQRIFAVPAPAAPREPAVAPVPPAPAPAPSAPTAETASPVTTTAMPAPVPAPEYTAPAAPAPVAWDYARPAEPAAAAQQPEQSTPEKSEDPLSGLAHLAAAVQQTQPMPTASDPQVPSLDVPSVPTVRSLNLDAMPSLDIPDLSFPTFDNDEPTRKKPEQ